MEDRYLQQKMTKLKRKYGYLKVSSLQEDIDYYNTFSPKVQADSHIIIIETASIYKWKLKKFIIKTVYPNVKLKNIYIIYIHENT